MRGELAALRDQGTRRTAFLMYAPKQPDELQAFTALHDSDLSRTAPCMNIKCGDQNGSLLGRAGTGARWRGVGCRLLRYKQCATITALLLTHLVMKLETTTPERSTLVVVLSVCI